MLDKYYHTKDGYYTREKMNAYLNGDLEDYERRAFEKLLEEDPFLRDAMEGVQAAGWDKTQKHLRQVDKKVDILSGVSKPATFNMQWRNMAVAAMVLVLIGASYFIIQQIDTSTSNNQSAMEDPIEKSEENYMEQPVLETEPEIGNTPVVEEETVNELPPAEQLRDAAELDEEIEAAVRSEDLVVADEIELEDDMELRQPEETPAAPEMKTREAEVDDSNVTTTFSGDVLSGTTASEQNYYDTYSVVEEEPQFPGGPKALEKYLAETIQYPPQAKDSQIEGTVYVSFVITETGDIVESRVVKGIGGECDEEALRAVNNMPAWMPASQGGVFVKRQYTLPVRFNLD